MIEPKQVTINLKTFQLTQIPAMKALRLDKKVVSLVLPVLGGVDGLDQEIKLSKVLSTFSDSLSSMKDDEFIKFIVDMLHGTTMVAEGSGAIELNSEAEINNAFVGDLVTIYKLLWEIMKFNKFTPFVMVGGGGLGTMKTLFSGRGMQKESDSGKELAKSGL